MCPTPLTPVPGPLLGRPFTTAQARRLGVTEAMLRGDRYAPVTRGVHFGGAAPDLEARVRGTLAVLPPGTAVTGTTGLHLWGVAVGSPDPLTFVTTHPHQVRRSGIRVTRRPGPPPASRREPAAACFAAADLGLLELVVAGDWLVQLGRTTPDRLSSAVVPGRRGAKRHRRAAALVRVGVESPRETELRLLGVLAGLPEPSCNTEIYAGARWLARGDLVWEEHRVIVEYDGLQHLTDRDQWERDVLRLEALARAGWTVVRVTARRLRNRREALAAMEAALRAGGWRGRAVLTPEWRALFATAR